MTTDDTPQPDPTEPGVRAIDCHTIRAVVAVGEGQDLGQVREMIFMIKCSNHKMTVEDLPTDQLLAEISRRAGR